MGAARRGRPALERSYAAIPPAAPVRLAKPTSNLFRARTGTDAPGLDVSGLAGVIEVDPRRPHGRRAGHVHLRGPRRRHAAARAHPARGAAAAHDHARRGGHRPRHRVDVVPQRPAARVGARDGRLHRRRRGRHGEARRRALRRVRRTPTARSATRPGCASSSRRCRRTSSCGTSASTDVDDLAAAVGEITDDPRVGRRRASTASTACAFAPDEAYLTLATLDVRAGRDQRLHRAGRSTSGRSRSARPTGSRCTTTCGAGTPTGSGARAPSGCTTRGCGGCGRDAGGAATSTTGSCGLDQRVGISRAPRPPQRRQPRARHPGHRGPGRPDRRVPRLVRRRRSACDRSGCARCGCGEPDGPGSARAWPTYPLEPGTTYVNAGFWGTVADPATVAGRRR